MKEKIEMEKKRKRNATKKKIEKKNRFKHNLFRQTNHFYSQNVKYMFTFQFIYNKNIDKSSPIGTTKIVEETFLFLSASRNCN